MKIIAVRLLLLSLLCLSTFTQAQDLNARVQILSPQIQNTNKRTLDVLEQTIRDFLNNRKWSTDTYRPQERIDCNFIINVLEWDGASNFKTEVQIQSSRPVYGTSYNSTILNISDRDFSFSYTEGQALDFSEQTYINNLSSLLAFYAYIIVGLDNDTYSKFSGTLYFTKAQTIVASAQNTSFAGWQAFEGLRNRYWLVENLLNKSYNVFREALYSFHRAGLDLMADSETKARKNIYDVLLSLQKFDKQKQGAMFNQLFFTAKADEIVNLIRPFKPQEKLKAYAILSSLDPSNQNKYEQLKQ